MLFSILMLRDQRFGRAIGAFGIASAGALLALNLWTFPLPPAEAGLWDVGPLTGVWWIAAIVLALRSERSPDLERADASSLQEQRARL